MQKQAIYNTKEQRKRIIRLAESQGLTLINDDFGMHYNLLTFSDDIKLLELSSYDKLEERVRALEEKLR